MLVEPVAGCAPPTRAPRPAGRPGTGRSRRGRAAPLLRRLGQPAVQREPGAIGVDPPPQPRPGADQRLVRDLDTARRPRSLQVVSSRAATSAVEHGSTPPRPVQLARAARAGACPPCLRPAGSAAAASAGRSPARRREKPPRSPRRAWRAPLDAARVAVALERQHPPAAALPQLQQRVLEQRQRALARRRRRRGSCRPALLELQARRGARAPRSPAAAPSRPIGPTSSCCAADQLRQLGVAPRSAGRSRRAASSTTTVRPAGRRRGVAAGWQNSARARPRRRQSVNDLLELVDDQQRPARPARRPAPAPRARCSVRGSAASPSSVACIARSGGELAIAAASAVSGAAPGRRTRIRQRSLPAGRRACSAGSEPGAHERGLAAARRTEDRQEARRA